MRRPSAVCGLGHAQPSVDGAANAWARPMLRRDGGERQGDGPRACSAAWHPTGRYFAVGYDNGSYAIWDGTAAKGPFLHRNGPRWEARVAGNVDGTRRGFH